MTVTFEARDLPPLHPTDRAAREVATLPRYDLAQELASLRAQVHSLTEQLHTPAAREFVREQVDVADWQWLADDTFAVEGREYAMNIAQAMLDDGLEVR